MIVYVAGASAELERARDVMRRLAAFGLEVAHDWTIPVEEHGSAHPDPDECRRFALADEAAVDRASATLLLVPHEATEGAWWEASRARALGRTLVASGASEDVAAMIFVRLADAVFEVPAWPAGATYTRGEFFEQDRVAYSEAQAMADSAAVAWLAARARDEASA